MKIENTKVLTAFIVVSVVMTCAAAYAKPSSIELATKQQTIKQGEPLVVTFTYRWPEPMISSQTGKIREGITGSTSLTVRRPGRQALIWEFPIRDGTLTLEGTEGVQYQDSYVILYDYFREKLVFEEPGDYIVQADGWTVESKPLTIRVLPPGESEKKSFSLFKDPNIYPFLLRGSCEHPDDPNERGGFLSQLREVADTCPETLLGKWAAARVGVEYLKDFLQQNYARVKTTGEKARRVADDPLYREARKYLAAGYGLPDEHPFREEVISCLWRTAGDYDKAISLLEELEKKYPHGEFGRRAAEAKEQLEKRRPVEPPRPSPEAPSGQGLWSRGRVIIATVAAGTVAAATVLALVLTRALKKRPRTGAR